MDGLALLCNLFADGPVTLRRLRAARIAHLSELEHADPAALSEILMSSVPQSRAFSEEARKLVRRLAEEAPRTAQRTAQRTEQRTEQRTVLASTPSARVAEPVPTAPVHASQPSAAPASEAGLRRADDEVLLTPGLFPGLDEAVCARLARHQVRTVRALGEFAGLTLARRTGIPYSSLLELAREARRHAQARSRATVTSAPLQASRPATAPSAASPRTAAPATRAEPEREVTLTPFLNQPRRAPSEAELAPSDAFTLPPVEPGSAGPFG